jgi:hypothetical protein
MGRARKLGAFLGLLIRQRVIGWRRAFKSTFKTALEHTHTARANYCSYEDRSPHRREVVFAIERIVDVRGSAIREVIQG